MSSSRSQLPPLLNETSDWDTLDDETRLQLRGIQVGHNLNSVLHNPNPSSGMASFQSSMFSEGLSFLGRVFERDDHESSLPVPSVITQVDLEDFNNFRADNSIAVDQYLCNHGHQQTAVESAFEDGISPSRRRTEEFKRAKGGKSAMDMLQHCFDEVPAKFFLQDFNLDDPAIFESSSNHAASALMQENLSNWLDLVEVCLWSQTTSQASSFFGALKDLRELKAQVSEACAQIAKLRKHIENVKRRIVMDNLVVLQSKRCIKNRQVLDGMLQRIVEVRNALPTVKEILNNTQDYVCALDLIERTQQTLNGELRGVHCLQTIGRQLSEYQEMIGEQLGNRFIELSVNWDLGEGDDVEEDDDLMDDAGNQVDDQDPEMYRIDGMGVLIRGTMRMKTERVRSLLQRYRVRVLEEVHVKWTNTQISALDSLKSIDEDGDRDQGATQANGTTGSGALAHKQVEKQLAALDPKLYVSYLELMFYMLQGIIKRARGVHNEVDLVVMEMLQGGTAGENGDAAHGSVQKNGQVDQQNGEAVENGIANGNSDVTATANGNSDVTTTTNGNSDATTTANGNPPLSKKLRTQLERLITVSRGIFESIMDEIQRRLQSELDSRRKLNAHAHMDDLCQLWNVVLRFIVKSERWMHMDRGTLKWMQVRGALLNLPKTYLTTLHEQHMTNMIEILDSDNWEIADVPYQVQLIVRYLETGRPNRRPSIANSGTESSRMSGHVSKELCILNKRYKMIRSMSTVLNYVERYLLFAQNFGSGGLAVLATDRLAQLLNRFSEHTDGLILGAGLRNNMIVDTIKTKHIARSSQALSIIIALLPCIEKLLLGSVGKRESQASSTHVDEVRSKLEQVGANFQMHRERVFARLVTLVDDMLEATCSNLAVLVNWDAVDVTGNTANGKAQPYMEKVIRSVTHFYKQLKQVLPHDQLQQVFGMVFDLINSKIPVYFESVNPSTPMGRSRVRVDIRRLVSSLRQLRGLSGPGDALEQFVQERFDVTNS